jgi:hypothetical protein
LWVVGSPERAVRILAILPQLVDVDLVTYLAPDPLGRRGIVEYTIPLRLAIVQTARGKGIGTVKTDICWGGLGDAQCYVEHAWWNGLHRRNGAPWLGAWRDRRGCTVTRTPFRPLPGSGAKTPGRPRASGREAHVGQAVCDRVELPLNVMILDRRETPGSPLGCRVSDLHAGVDYSPAARHLHDHDHAVAPHFQVDLPEFRKEKGSSIESEEQGFILSLVIV